jgi:molybdopterin/thiamine biosynthesis adenylyltransferase
MDHARYLRQQAVEGLAIERLRALDVVVVGAGAVGNEVVKNLVLLGVGRIDLHDFDRVELHNLTRSVFLRETDVGASKAAAVAARAAEVDPASRVCAVEGDAWRTLTLARLARADVLICAVDNLEARMRLGALAQLAGVDMINAGIDARHASVETFPFRGAPGGACFECHLPESAYRRVAERYSCGWLRRALLQEAVVPTTAITASVAGALAVQAALRGDARGGARRVLVDTVTGASTVTALQRNPACAGCGALDPHPRRVAASDWAAALDAHAPGADALVLSDALIFSAACVHCGPADAARCVGRRADEFDDGIMRCTRCGELAVRVDVRAECTPDELRRLGTAPPVKYLLAHAGTPAALVIDLEE